MKRKVKTDKITYYNENERNKIITSFMFKLIEGGMDHVLTQEVKNEVAKYIKTGTPYKTSLNLPEYTSVLDINLSNIKQDDTYINFKIMDSEEMLNN